VKLYDVEGHDQPLYLSPEHAELIGATEHAAGERPARSARVGEWRDYAQSLGLDADVAASMTRTQLIEQYGDL
jgi:hypothetical protein